MITMIIMLLLSIEEVVVWEAKSKAASRRGYVLGKQHQMIDKALRV